MNIGEETEVVEIEPVPTDLPVEEPAQAPERKEEVPA